MAWYSYNGVILPELPFWDSITYPYAAIYFTASIEHGFYAYLYCSDIPFEYDVDTGYFIKADAQVQRYACIGSISITMDNWSLEMQGIGIGSGADGSYLVWANKDVRKSGGVMYLPASDPVPIETLAGSGEYLYLGDISEKVPDWTDWDRTKFPHAILTKRIEDDYKVYTLAYSDLPFLYENGYYNSTEGATHFYQHYVNAFDSPIWSEPRTQVFGTFLPVLTEVVWHTALYDEKGNLEKKASPEPRKKYPIVDWVTGYLIGEMENPRPISVLQIYDNEWPIEWNYPRIVVNESARFGDWVIIKVSDIIPTMGDQESMVLDITENGVTKTFNFDHFFLNYVEQNMVEMKNVDGTDTKTFFVVRTPGDTLSVQFREPGLYIANMLDDMQTKNYSLRLLEWPIKWSYPEMLSDHIVDIGTGIKLFKVSNRVLNEDEFERLAVDIVENGVTTTLRFNSSFWKEANGSAVDFVNDTGTHGVTLYMVHTAGKYNGIECPTPGIYHLRANSEGTEDKEYYLLEPIITVPDNVLISADGYVLTDRNGVYLIPRDSGNEATRIQFIVTGNEEFTYNSSNKAVYFKNNDVALKTKAQIINATCTHFTYGSGNVLAEMKDGEFIFNITVADGLTTGNVSFKNNAVFTSKKTAVAWFKEQLANGTPVTVTCYIKEE